MEREVKHYYRVTLKNIFVENSMKESVFAVLEDGKVYELLTGKRIYFAPDKSDFDVVMFSEEKYRLIGIELEECSVNDISKFLKFITNDEKEDIIERVKRQEQSIIDSLNSLDFYESSYVKIRKKPKFWGKY